MTADEMVTEVLAHQFSAQRYTALVYKWLNDAERDMIRRAKVRTQMQADDFSTVASTQSYSLPTDFSSFESLSDRTNANFLQPLSLREFDDLAASSGYPDSYIVIDSLIYLYPTPSSVVNLRLRYWALPALLGAGGTSVIPADYHDNHVSYALAKAYVAEHDFDAASYHRNEYETGLLRMRTELTEDSREYPEQVQGMLGYYG